MRYLLAERGEIEQILAEIPEDEVLVRGSFLARLEDVDERIAAFGADIREPVQARLTFRGRPVVGGHGVFAAFGGKATSDFAAAVTAMAATAAGPLGASGPLPNRDQHRLLITGTAVGSFGFVLEEYREPEGEQLSLGLDAESAVAQALRQTTDLLAGTQGTDEDLADAVSTVDPRARAAVRAFLETLAANDAAFALEAGGSSVSFPDVTAVRRGVQRLSQENIHEEQQAFDGSFQGVLPKRRTFELRLSGSDEVISGRIGPGIAQPDALNERLYRPARVQLTAVLVGAGRPRYVLNEQPEWLEPSAQATPASD